jgi:hypothetical protein
MAKSIWSYLNRSNQTVSGSGTGANLLPGSAPTTGTGVSWAAGTATATNATDIVRWAGLALVPGQAYVATFNYNKTGGSKFRITNGNANGSEWAAISDAVANGSGTISIPFIARDTGFSIEAEAVVYSGTISSITVQDLLTATATSTGAGGVRSDRPLSGLTYFEAVLTTLTGTPQIGIASPLWNNSTALGSTTASLGYLPSGIVQYNGATLATIQTYTAADRVEVAVNPADRFIWFRVNGGNWNNNAANDPATNVGGIDYSGMANLSTMFAAVYASLTGTVWTATFTPAFTHTVPTNYNSLDTQAYTRADASSDPAQGFGMAIMNVTTPPATQIRASNFGKDGTTLGKHFFGSFITRVSGTIYELSVPVAGRRVDVYDRVTGELLGTTTSAGDGSWSLPCQARTTVRVVASDPTAYNSLCYDNVSPA